MHMPIPLPPETMSQLRQQFARYTGDVRGRRRPANDDVSAPISDFLMVGGVIEEDGMLSIRDSALLGAAAMGLTISGATVAPNFTASVVNLDPEQGGEDFLSPKFKAKADAVLMCLLYNREPGCLNTEAVYANSPRHNEPGIWHDKVIETGARALVVLGDGASMLRAEKEVGGEVHRGFFLKEGGRLSHVKHGELPLMDIDGEMAASGIDLLLRDDYEAHLEQKNGRRFDPPQMSLHESSLERALSLLGSGPESGFSPSPQRLKLLSALAALQEEMAKDRDGSEFDLLTELDDEMEMLGRSRELLTMPAGVTLVVSSGKKPSAPRSRKSDPLRRRR
jgi:hypothetical protein